ncbi:MAG: dTDP-4-dehydrorhamnose 3,5-epimerase [Anaerolineae bacterium]|nr:MAG: dTDP-4-dehydrorhamnose 3,5-epimerase [Anaerolineae bacterium]
MRPLGIPDVLEIQPRAFGDVRGRFAELYRADGYAALGHEFVQDNLARSARGTLRGMHYQIEQAQGKLVTALEGEVFDVAVDMRRSSATFGQWVGLQLSGERLNQIWVPPGFSHGYYVMSEVAVVVYKVTALYAPDYERTLRWDDADVGIEWPFPAGEAPLLSDKDRAGKLWGEADAYA